MGITVKEILSKYDTGLIGRPEYYSGRGNNTGDLNSEMLEKVWGGIKKEHGVEAAKAMVNMVNDLGDTSATGFLVGLFALENNGWQHSEANVPQNRAQSFADITSRAHDSGDMKAMSAIRHGMMGVMAGFYGGDTGHSGAVTGMFLRRHREEISGKMRDLRGRDSMDGFILR